ncbi:MAG: precorrin-6y C5,15-methyltransferase (decarboxylating) subunit CbiE [Acidimicrobiales bacterium]
MADPRIDVVGLHGGEPWGHGAMTALADAQIVAGSARHLAQVRVRLGPGAEEVTLSGPLPAFLDELDTLSREGRRVCLLASGDPGFFGIAHLAAARLGAARLRVHPAPSSVSLAFSRVAERWDDAVVVSAHGRPLDLAVSTALANPKVAVLTAPDQPPEALGRALRQNGIGPRRVVVASRLGEADERVVHCDVDGLAQGQFDGLSVVLLLSPERGDHQGAGLRWGREEAAFQHRAGMITKGEVRAVALGKLGLPATGTLWDVGAGSGSVAVEAARISPALSVLAVERRADDAARIRANAAGLSVTVVEGEAPAALVDLPDPDRVFVGGGGLSVLDAVLGRLRPGGTVVATWASLDRAAAAAERLGNLVQVAVSRGVRFGEDDALRLAAENPVFITWGPTDREAR